MPVIFTIQEKEYTYPQGWEDVTLTKWLESLDKLKKPEALAKLHSIDDEEKRRAFVDENITPEVYGLELVPYFLKFFCFWTGVSEDVALKMKMDDLEKMYQQIELNFSRSMVKAHKEASDQIQFGGRIYYLPTEHLKKGTVNEFIEAAQAEHLAQQVKGNQLHAIPKLLCIFLKTTKDAPYNPKQMEREPLFMKMTMDKVFRVSFFLSRLSEKLARVSLISTALYNLSLQQHKGAQA